MGCGCSKAQDVGNPQMQNDATLARRLQEEENRRGRAAANSGGGGPGSTGTSGPRQQSWNSAGAGHSLGGGGEALSPEERRQRALEAAERRQDNIAGVSTEKAKQMRTKQQKDELLGKLTEFYRSKKLEMPMGLNAASVEQLRTHLDQVKKGQDPTQVLLSS
mmetsp:Transcript_71595/g.221082  ORF Transcript_71595/g.221082 Transcript_71595/m.221082 type:complete len:162 (+) Transcript_71595:84-569(+)